MKKFVSAMLAGAMALSLAACGASSSAPESSSAAEDSSSAATTEAAAPAAEGAATGTLKIGGIGPLTGSAAVYGIATKQGAEIAIEEINALGGLQLSLDFQDDTGVAETAVNAYNSLKDSAQVIYGCTTTDPCLNVAAETFNDRIFQVTPSASSTKVTEGRDNVFQMCFTDPNQGASAADYVYNNALGTKIGIIYNNSDAYSTGLYEAFKTRASEIGLEVVAEAAFPDDTNADFSAQLGAMQTAGADLVFLPIYYTPAYNIISAANAMGYAPSFFGCDGMDGILAIDNMDPALVEGLMLMTPFNADSDDAATASFVAKYQEAYGETPNQFAADGYDAMYALYAAANKAGIDADSLTASEVCELMIAAFTANDFSIDGLTGSGMTWSTVGEISKDPVAVVIKDGKYVNM